MYIFAIQIDILFDLSKFGQNLSKFNFQSKFVMLKISFIILIKKSAKTIQFVEQLPVNQFQQKPSNILIT